MAIPEKFHGVFTNHIISLFQLEHYFELASSILMHIFISLLRICYNCP